MGKPELTTKTVLAAIRDHGDAAYDFLVDDYPPDKVIAEFTKAARSGLTTFGLAVHMATLTEKGRKELG